MPDIELNQKGHRFGPARPDGRQRLERHRELAAREPELGKEPVHAAREPRRALGAASGERRRRRLQGGGGCGPPRGKRAKVQLGGVEEIELRGGGIAGREHGGE